MSEQTSTKRALIDKANSRVVIVTSVAAFILVFSLVATKTLISQAAYQNRVISAKRTAVTQLKQDISSTKVLKESYDAFNNTNQNVLGGSPTGVTSKDGSNSKIILDALPSNYDFPALTASLETLMTSQNVQISSISGTDDEVTQGNNQSSTTPQPVPMPFQLVVSGDYQSVQGLVNVFEHSIRPIQLQTLDITGSSNKLELKITAQTFYQPAKSLNINKKVIQ